jgi:hypothetical protein
VRGRRTDLIFVIYVYQRWVYRVDMKRVNEFGFGGDNEGKPAALAGVGDATKQNKGVRAPPNTSRLLSHPTHECEGEGRRWGNRSEAKRGGAMGAVRRTSMYAYASLWLG